MTREWGFFASTSVRRRRTRQSLLIGRREPRILDLHERDLSTHQLNLGTRDRTASPTSYDLGAQLHDTHRY